TGASHTNRAEQLAIRDEDEAVRPTGKARVEATFDQCQTPGRRRAGKPGRGRGDDVRLTQALRQSRRLIRRQHDPNSFPSPPAHRLGESADRGWGQDAVVPPEPV